MTREFDRHSSGGWPRYKVSKPNDGGRLAISLRDYYFFIIVAGRIRRSVGRRIIKQKQKKQKPITSAADAVGNEHTAHVKLSRQTVFNPAQAVEMIEFVRREKTTLPLFLSPYYHYIFVFRSCTLRPYCSGATPYGKSVREKIPNFYCAQLSGREIADNSDFVWRRFWFMSFCFHRGSYDFLSVPVKQGKRMCYVKKKPRYP